MLAASPRRPIPESISDPFPELLRLVADEALIAIPAFFAFVLLFALAGLALHLRRKHPDFFRRRRLNARIRRAFRGRLRIATRSSSPQSLLYRLFLYGLAILIAAAFLPLFIALAANPNPELPLTALLLGAIILVVWLIRQLRRSQSRLRIQDVPHFPAKLLRSLPWLLLLGAAAFILFSIRSI